MPTSTVSVLSKLGESASVHEGIGILHGRDDAGDARLDDAVSARARPSGMDARLEGAVQRCPACTWARLLKGENLSVRLPCSFMTAIADDDLVGIDDTGSDDRVRRGATETTPCGWASARRIHRASSTTMPGRGRPRSPSRRRE